ncbi:PaaI family thioesterase [Novosphingobium sp. MMS21-SN21R]|uniref:PaaI family thioesterase n=1 Tax=Novosphingobium sp. MMS21-SN21R TaxID=2969298 RepID=UPI002886757B|nr:PaaI family thioesterase [Novosphingobium sp. MMS21-SN21R]MDT0508465.1 PaaI family thioesterase [Novosphingobium sp. MMS21-SN21R]
MQTFDKPDLPGNWTCDFNTGVGEWSLGGIWLDRQGARLAVRVAQHHCNAFGVMHGGALATFADGQALAVRTYSGGADDHTPTVSLSVDYLGGAPLGSWVVADVTLLRTTRTLLFTQALVTADGKPVARTSAIYRNFKGKDAQ